MKTKANIAIVYSGFLEDLPQISELIKSLDGDIIFIKKSVGKLWIKEENNDN